MDITEKINLFAEFLEKNYIEKIINPKILRTTNLVIDFRILSEYNLELANLLLDDPEDTLECLKLACTTNLNPKLKDKNSFVVRIKNTPSSIKIPINEIRVSDIGKLVTVAGVIKQKNEVIGNIISSKFECPSCGNVIHLVQKEDDYQTPKQCGCGRKGGFTELSQQLVNQYSMSLEEPNDELTGGSKLSRLQILAEKGLANKNIERVLTQGLNIEITGILKKKQKVSRNNKLMNKVFWFLDTNYISLSEESFSNMSWTKEEEKEFKKLASKKDWLDILRRNIFYDVKGYTEECEGVVLQMFSGVSKETEGASIRGNFHVLLIGDPGSAKSTILKIAQKFHPKAMYVAGTGVTGVGLTGAAVKDELLGGWTIEAGPLALCNGGMLAIDELDKINPEYLKALHEPLEQETYTVAKAGQNSTFTTKTSVLAAANPKFGSYSDAESLYNQVTFSSTLINRFDLVFPIKESDLTSDDDYDIAMKIFDRGEQKISEERELSKEFIKKYIAYAKNIVPVMDKEVKIYLANKYTILKKIKRKLTADLQEAIPVSARNVDGLRRVCEAVAKSRLRTKVTFEDAEIGLNKVLYSLKKMGIDPESGEGFSTYDTKGKGFKDKDLKVRLLRVMREFSKKDLKTVPIVDIYIQLSEQGFTDEDAIDDIIAKLCKTGDLFEPTNNHYRMVFSK